MNLGNLIQQMVFNKPLVRHESGFSPIESSKGIFNISQDLYGDEDYTYYVLIISLFDRAIVEDNLHTLSKEQQKLLEQYFTEAKPLTPAGTVNIDTHKYDFSVLSKHIRILDEFLGSYIGEDNGEYSRYGKKFFHSQRKPFSTKAESIAGA